MRLVKWLNRGEINAKAQWCKDAKVELCVCLFQNNGFQIERSGRKLAYYFHDTEWALQHGRYCALAMDARCVLSVAG